MSKLYTEAEMVVRERAWSRFLQQMLLLGDSQQDAERLWENSRKIRRAWIALAREELSDDNRHVFNL